MLRYSRGIMQTPALSCAVKPFRAASTKAACVNDVDVSSDFAVSKLEVVGHRRASRERPLLAM